MGGQRRLGQQAGVEDAEQETGKGEGIREAHCLCVHDGQTEEKEAEDGHADACDAQAELQKAEQEEGGSGELYCGVAPWDRTLAGAAAAPEKNPAEDGDVVACQNGRAAIGTMGRWADDGFVVRQPGDADVEEAAEGESEEDDEDGDEEGQLGWAPVQL